MKKQEKTTIVIDGVLAYIYEDGHLESLYWNGEKMEFIKHEDKEAFKKYIKDTTEKGAWL